MKTLLYNHLSIQIKQLQSLNVFTGSKVKSSKNPWRNPQNFISLASIANPSELGGLQHKSMRTARYLALSTKYFSRIVIVFSNI